MPPRELIRKDGVTIAKFGDDQGSAKLQTVPVVTVEKDQGGKVVSRRTVRKCADLLDRWYHQDLIKDGQYAAGRKFQELAHKAQINPSTTVAFDRVSASHGPLRLQDRILDASTALNKAVKVLGGHRSQAVGVCWYALGCNQTIAETARRVRWGGGMTSNAAVRGMLVVSLSVLQNHWGLE